MTTFTDEDLDGVNHLVIRATSMAPDAVVTILPAPEYMATCQLRRSMRLRKAGKAPRARRTSTASRSKGSRRGKAASPSRGDPDEGDPDPGGPARADQGDLKKGRHCLGCGHGIGHKRPQARYCDESCRKAYQRRGKVAAAPVPPVEVVPLGDVLGAINKAARDRQAAWLGRVEADPELLTTQLALLWDVARRARAGQGVAA
jgi:hypothetical protein